MTSRTFNDAFGDLIHHLKFQMRKVLETRNLNQATRHSPPEGRGCLGMRLLSFSDSRRRGGTWDTPLQSC